MTRLVDLLHSLTAVIVRYYDSHAVEKIIVGLVEPSLLKKKTREYSPVILNDEEVGYKKRLEDLIKLCTDAYPGRRHLLDYFLNEIVYLKTMHARQKSFKPAELTQYKEQIAQMLIDFRQLLLTTKSETYKTTRHSIEDVSAKIDLSGLKNDSYYGNKLCFSGDLLTEVLDRFIISSNSTDEEINKFAEELCTEHQNSLLVIELTQKNEAQLKQIEASAIQTASLAAQLTEKQELIVAQERQIAELNVQLAPRPKAEVAETNEISALKTQLTLVNEELEATRAQLKRQESATKQKGPLAFPLYGRPFHGFSPFFATFDSQQMRKLSQLPNGNSNQADPIQATDTPSV